MKVISKSAFVLVVALTVVSLATPAQAFCLFGSGFDSVASEIMSPAGPGDLARVKGNFWSMGNGAGANNGLYPVSEWARIDTSFYVGAYYIAGDWAGDPRIVGCIQTEPANPPPQKMVYTLQDNNGSDSWFTIQCIQENASAGFSFAAGGPLGTMALIPKPRITASSRAGNVTNMSITHSPLDASAVVADGNCGLTPGSLVTGFKIYSQTVPRNGPPPTNRDRQTGGWILQGSAGIGGSVAGSAVCGADSDIYLSTSLVFESGVESQVVSANSTRVECGPNLATTPEGDFRAIRRPKVKGR